MNICECSHPEPNGFSVCRQCGCVVESALPKAIQYMPTHISLVEAPPDPECKLYLQQFGRGQRPSFEVIDDAQYDMSARTIRWRDIVEIKVLTPAESHHYETLMRRVHDWLYGEFPEMQIIPPESMARLETPMGDVQISRRFSATPVWGWKYDPYCQWWEESDTSLRNRLVDRMNNNPTTVHVTTGTALDAMGELFVKLKRDDGESDDSYRKRIRAVLWI